MAFEFFKAVAPFSYPLISGTGVRHMILYFRIVYLLKRTFKYSMKTFHYHFACILKDYMFVVQNAIENYAFRLVTLRCV